jgi:hypothetical protein
MDPAVVDALRRRAWLRLEDTRSVVARIAPLLPDRDRVALVLLVKEADGRVVFPSWRVPEFQAFGDGSSLVYEVPLSSLRGADPWAYNSLTAYNSAPQLILGVVPAPSAASAHVESSNSKVRVDVDWTGVIEERASPSPLSTLAGACAFACAFGVFTLGGLLLDPALFTAAPLASALIWLGAQRLVPRALSLMKTASERASQGRAFPCKRTTWALTVPASGPGNPPFAPFLWGSTYLPLKNVCHLATVRARSLGPNAEEEPRLLCAAVPRMPHVSLAAPDGTTIRLAEGIWVGPDGRVVRGFAPVYAMPDLDALALDIARAERARDFRATPLFEELMQRVWHPARLARAGLDALDS